MFGLIIRDVLASRRQQTGLTRSVLAHRAGIFPERYRLLEPGNGWPGTAAYTAVLDALEIQGPDRLTIPDTSLSSTERFLLIPSAHWAVADHAWCLVEISPTHAEQLPPAAAGSNLLAWLLLDPDAERRLANHHDLRATARMTLDAALRADPDDPGLIALRDQVGTDQQPAPGCPATFDGTAWVWRTDTGPYTVWDCLCATPGS